MLSFPPSTTVPFHVDSCRPRDDLSFFLRQLQSQLLFHRLSRHVSLRFCDALFRRFGGCECCGVPSAGAHKGASLSYGWCRGNADGFVSAPWLGAVRRRLNPYKLMFVVTTFVYVSSGLITSHSPFLLGSPWNCQAPRNQRHPGGNTYQSSRW